MGAFPVDDVTLDLLDHALGGSLNEDNEVVGADMTLSRLLDFMSGPSVEVPVTNEYGDHLADERVETAFSHEDVIRALVREVRSLRNQ